MTDELNAEQTAMKIIHDMFEKKMQELNIPIRWFLQTSIGEDTLYSGNGCPVCAIEAAKSWLEDNNYTHLADDLPKSVN